MSFKVQHKRSSEPHRRPSPAELLEGQFGVNFDSESPGLFYRTAQNSLIKVGPPHLGFIPPQPIGHNQLSVGELWADPSDPNDVLFKMWDGQKWIRVGGIGGADIWVGDIHVAGDAFLGEGCQESKVIINGETEMKCPITVSGCFQSDLLPCETLTYSLGSDEKRWKTVYAGNIDVDDATLGHNCNDLITIKGAAVFECGVSFTGCVGSHLVPCSNNTYDLGSSSARWRNVFTGDLNLSNEGGENEVDGSWGSYTIQEGHEDLFLINRRTGKRYRFNLEEVI